VPCYPNAKYLHYTSHIKVVTCNIASAPAAASADVDTVTGGAVQ
jgi:hypothetical protein